MAADLINIWALTVGPVVVELTPWVSLVVLLVLVRRVATSPAKGER
jgi:hypothetical protein